MKKHHGEPHERRQYVRLDTVFPVEFQICLKTGEIVSQFKQGFTRNVSEGGICLEVNELEDGLVEKIQSPGSELRLLINIPHHKIPIQAKALIRWSSKVKDSAPHRYLFGLEYVDIQLPLRKTIIGYAKKLRRRPKMIAFGIAVLMAACALLVWQVYEISVKKSITEERLLSLGEALTEAHQQRIGLESKLYALNMNRQHLEQSLDENKNIVDSLAERLAAMTGIGDTLSEELLSQKIALEQQIVHWQREKQSLLEQLSDLTVSKESLVNELHTLKDASSSRILRVRLTNGNAIVGQLIDLTADRLDIKIGLGSIGIERALISSIREVSPQEKMDIQQEWRAQENRAKRDAERHKNFMRSQTDRGLVYFNGKWIRKEEAKQIHEDIQRKEQEVFQLISGKRAGGETPNLLETLLRKEQKPVISIKNNRLYLRGRLFFVKGIGYGIEYPGTAGSMDTYKKIPLGLFEKDFRMIKAAGINTIRTYEPLPVALLDLLEKHDIMVIQNVCYPSDNTDFTSKVHLDILKQQARKYVARDKDRKCILMWSIWNDAPWAWGEPGNVVSRYGFNTVNSFLRELYDTVKKYDISRPVIGSNAIGLEGERLGWDFLDVIGLNLYVGGFEWFTEAEAERNIAEAKAIQEKYKKPVIILETGFSTFVDGQEQSEVLEKQIKKVGTHLAGITVFQWADGWQKAGDPDTHNFHIEEHWGIVDGYRNPKPGYETIRRLFNEIPDESYGYSPGVPKGAEELAVGDVRR